MVHNRQMPAPLRVTRTGELASLLELAAVDTRIRHAQAATLEQSRHLHECGARIEVLARSLEGDRAKLADLAQRPDERHRIERAIVAREQEIARLVEVLESDRRRAEPVLARAYEVVCAAPAEREEILRSLDRALVAHYETLTQRGILSFIVPARDGRCAGCVQRLSPTLMETLQRSEAIVSCPHCARMLYVRGP